MPAHAPEPRLSGAPAIGLADSPGARNTARAGPAARPRLFPLTVLLFSLGYLSYFLSKVVFVLCTLPLLLLLAPFPQAKSRILQRMTHGFLGFFTRTWLPALGLYRIVEISGLAPAGAAAPAVCVANHRGFMDALLVLGLLPRTGVVIKARDTQQTTYALLARHFDLVSIDASALRSVGASIEKSQALLAGGKSVLFFPEGTRARTRRLQRFNRLAFQVALAAQRPIVPVLLHSTQPFMAKVPGSIFPREPNEYRIRFLSPEWPRPDDTAEAWSDRVHQRMARELRPLDAETAWEAGPSS